MTQEERDEIAKTATKRDRRIGCPFCDSENVDYRGVPGTNFGRHSCNKCGCEGPLSGSLMASRLAWNTRTSYKEIEVINKGQRY